MKNKTEIKIKNQSLKKNEPKLIWWQFAVLILVFLILFSGQYGTSFNEIKSKRTVSTIWYKCIEYTKAGDLYEGHVECARGPIFFYTLTGLSLIFGEPDSISFQFSATIFLFILQLTLFLIFLKIIKKMGCDLFLPILFFLFLIFNSHTNSLETYSALIFIALAYYTLYFKEFKLKFLLVGFLAGLAFFLNITSLLALALALLFYLLFDKKDFGIHNKKLFFKKNLIKDLLHLLLGFSIVLSLFLVLHNNVLIYHLFVHLDITTKVSYLTSLKAMFFNFNIRYYMLYLLLGILVYSFIKTKKSIYIVSFLALFLNTLQMTNTGFLFTRTLITGTHYILSSLFFVALALSMLVKERIFLEKKKLFVPLLIFIFIFPGYVQSPLQKHMNEFFFKTQQKQEKLQDFRELVEGSLGEVINQEGIINVLYEFDGKGGERRYLSQRGANIGKINLDSPDNKMLGEGALYDPTLLKPFIKWLKQDYTNWISTHPINYSKAGLDEYTKKAAQGYYDLIIEGPPSWAATIEILKDEQVTKEISSYCILAIPDLTYIEGLGMNHKLLFFKDNTTCINSFYSLVSYYQNNYEKICDIDQNVINLWVIPTMMKLGVEFPKCDSGNFFLKTFIVDATTSNYNSVYIDSKEQKTYFLWIMGVSILSLIAGIFKNGYKRD